MLLLAVATWACGWWGQLRGGDGCRAPRAMAWPTRPLKKSQGPAKRGKTALVGVLQDPSTYEGKTLWAIGLMKKLKFFKSSWEYVLGMKKLTQVGRWDQALVLWREMRAHGIEANAAAYSAAIVALDTGGQWREAAALVEQMYLENMAPIRIGCEHAMMSYEKGKLWQQALRLLDEMWEHGVTPNEDSYLPAIRACENAGHFTEADDLFKQMRAQTKLAREAEAVGIDVNQRPPPKAKDAPWRIPGAISPTAYDPPRLLQAPKRRAPKGEPKPEPQPQV